MTGLIVQEMQPGSQAKAEAVSEHEAVRETVERDLLPHRHEPIAFIRVAPSDFPLGANRFLHEGMLLDAPALGFDPWGQA